MTIRDERSRSEVWSVAAEIDRLSDDPDTVPNGFFFQRSIDAGQRATALKNVFFDSDPAWLPSFIVMLLLSGGVATLGLSQDSAATVIGSMIIAPLGAPIVGLGGAVALAWPRESMRMLAVIVAGAASIVGAAILIGLFLPDATPNGQILARTSPDLRDLGVAVLAGAAGAYTQTRPKLSNSLVGVAIAVALVPPLATGGLMIEEGRWALARGAFTLFSANLLGITLAVAVVLLVTGFVPLPHLRATTGRVVGGLAASAVAVGLVAIPLGVTYSRAINNAQTATAVTRQVVETVGTANTAVDIGRVKVDGDNVTISLSDPTNAPDAAAFQADLADELGPNVSVAVEGP